MILRERMILKKRLILKKKTDDEKVDSGKTKEKTDK